MPKKPTYFQERKAFIARMISSDVKISYPKEQKFAKQIFEQFPVEFLNSVKKPFEMNSLAWFLSKDGTDYLSINFKIFNYKPKFKKIVEGTEKLGYSYKNKNLKSFRDFLDE